MLETILAEHRLPEAMQKELEDFVEDLTRRREEAERQIGIMAVMPRGCCLLRDADGPRTKTSAFRHDADPFNAQALGLSVENPLGLE